MADINANAAANFTAFLEGTTLIIVDRASDNSTFSATFQITPSGSGAVATVAKTTKATLSGTLVPGEVWHILLTVGADSSTFSHSIVSGDTLASVAAALAAAINASTDSIGADFTATTEGATLLIVNRAGQTFRTRLEISRADGTTVGALAADAASARVASTDLTGTAVAGETWSVQLTDGAGNLLSSDAYLVAANQSLSDVARALAADINANASADFTAMSEGAKLIVVNRDGNSFQLALGVAPVQRLAGAMAADQSAVKTTIGTLSGSPVAGEIWSVLITVGTTTNRFSHTVLAGQTLGQIAAALAANINANAGGSFAALADGAQLIISNRAGVAFTTAFQFTPTGSAAIAPNLAVTTMARLSGTPATGEVWSVRLSIGATTSIHSYTVAANDTLAQIAAALAASINATADANFPAAANAAFTASAEGSLLVITNRGGAAFMTEIDAQSVSRGDGYALGTFNYNMTAAEVQSRLQALYGFDGITVTASRTANDATYVITFVREQAGINFEQIEWGESRETTGLIPRANSSAEVRVGTIQDGATDNARLNNVQTITVDATGGTFKLVFIIENDIGELEEKVTTPICVQRVGARSVQGDQPDPQSQRRDHRHRSGVRSDYARSFQAVHRQRGGDQGRQCIPHHLPGRVCQARHPRHRHHRTHRPGPQRHRHAERHDERQRRNRRRDGNHDDDCAQRDAANGPGLGREIEGGIERGHVQLQSQRQLRRCRASRRDSRPRSTPKRRPTSRRQAKGRRC